VLAGAGLGEEGVERVVAAADRLVRRHLAVRLRKQDLRGCCIYRLGLVLSPYLFYFSAFLVGSLLLHPFLIIFPHAFLNARLFSCVYKPPETCQYNHFETDFHSRYLNTNPAG
jgi:hypothetical protein